MLELPNHFTGTYAKNILADWKIISDYIRQQTAWIRDTIQAEHEIHPLIPSLLTDLQINDALNGPFQTFFKMHLQTYATITKMDTALTIAKEDFFKDSEHINEKVFEVSQKSLDKLEFSTLKDLRNQLDEKTKEHFLQWESHVRNWGDLITKLLLTEFKKNNFKLSDIELQDVSVNQPMSELNDRFIHLQLEFPKLSKSHFDFQQYFTLKAMLAIQSALNRMQQSSTAQDIEQHLKTIHPAFKTIHKAEKELAQTQEKILQDLIKNIID